MQAPTLFNANYSSVHRITSGPEAALVIDYVDPVRQQRGTSGHGRHGPHRVLFRRGPRQVRPDRLHQRSRRSGHDAVVAGRIRELLRNDFRFLAARVNTATNR